MIFLFWEMYKLHWAICPHVLFVNFFIHLDNSSFLFLLVFSNKLRQESYGGMRGHYGFRVLGVYPRPLNKALGPTTDLFWWYKPFIFGRLCPICFFREHGFGNFIFVLQVSYFQ
jgi:hypothetical protein